RVITRTLEKDPKLRYQTASDLVSELRRLRRDTDARATGSTTATPSLTVPTAATPGGSAPVVEMPAVSATGPVARRPRWALFGVPAVLVIGMAAFWAWSSTRTPAFAERDVVLVTDFVNSTGDAVFDDALKQAVSVQLQQTAFVTLLADQQIQTTLAL